jgi:hypothetical protein
MTMEYGTITGRLVAAVADTPDDPDVNPDIVPITGTVTFTPSVKAILVASESVTVVPAPIVASLDANGYVSLNGVQSVTVLATNSTYYNPNGWTYRVSFDNLAANGRRVTFDPYNIEVPVGATVDLSSVTPVTGSTGTPIVRGPKGDTGAPGGTFTYANATQTYTAPGASNPIPALDAQSQLPTSVRVRSADNLTDSTTPEGAAVGRLGTPVEVVADLSRAEGARVDAQVEVSRTYSPAGSVIQKFRGGGYYWLGDATSGSNADVGANNIRLFPFFITGPARIDVGSMFLEVTVAGSSESTFTVAIYGEDGFGVPKNLIAQGAATSASTTGVKEVPVTATLNPGLYFYGVYVPTAATAPQFVQVGAGMRVSLGAPVLPGAGDRSTGFVVANISAPPATISTWPSTSVKSPRVGIKVTRQNPIGSNAFDADFANKGLTAYASIVHPERVSIVSDPLGSGRQVARLAPLDSDTGPTSSPRAQLDPPQNIRDGDRVWFGFSLLLPSDFPVVPAGGWVNFGEIYGAPYGGASPTKIYIDGSTGDFIGWRRSATYNDDMPWKMPVLRGQWMDFAIQARMSEDESVGYYEIWVNTGKGWRQQLLNGKQRLYTKTRDFTNNVGNSNAAIKLYRKPGMFDQLVAYFGSHKVGDTLESVDPHTYG